MLGVLLGWLARERERELSAQPEFFESRAHRPGYPKGRPQNFYGRKGVSPGVVPGLSGQAVFLWSTLIQAYTI
jgi:hypothetical protein